MSTGHNKKLPPSGEKAGKLEKQHQLLCSQSILVYWNREPVKTLLTKPEKHLQTKKHGTIGVLNLVGFVLDIFPTLKSLKQLTMYKKMHEHIWDKQTSWTVI